jgi:catechol 2,3-dioxygenase-like lactoylglutathione lyase family enzyme
MSLSFKKVDVINLFAEDLAGARSFYQEVLGLELAFQDETIAVFKLENTMVSVRAVSEATGLIAPTAVASPHAGSRFMLAVFVDNVDAMCAELTARGVAVNGPADRPWGMRTATFTDPAGHLWSVGQDLDVN